MCRLAAWLGPAVPLSVLLYDPPHSLEHQAYAPREMLRGHVNVDGTGVVWWPPAESAGRPEGDDASVPLRYVTDRPPWSDPNLPSLAARLTGRLQIAAVRSATPGVPFGPANVAPFVHGRLAGTHNGWLGRFREATGRELAARLPDHLHAAVDAVSDSLLVFLTVVKHHEAAPEDGLAAAVRRTVAEVIKVCASADAEATLNLVVADGDRVVAVRAAHAMAGNNPLYVCQGGPDRHGGTVLASEPLDDDDGWEPVADDHLVEVRIDGITTTPIGTSDVPA